jgi:proteic killer suppression protein
MIESFKDQASEDIFNGVNSKAARKACPQTLWQIAARKLDQLDSVQSLEELKIPPGNRLEVFRETKKPNTVFALMNSIEFVLCGVKQVLTR